MIFRFFVIVLFGLQMHVRRWWREYILLFLALLCISVFLCVTFIRPPDSFPIGTTVEIRRGASVVEISHELARIHVIRSPFAFRAAVRLCGASGGVNAGLYRFDTPLSLPQIVKRLVQGESGIAPVRITFPEGITAREMAELLPNTFPPEFAKVFLAEALPYEGYLFPDTYVLSSHDTPESVVKLLRGTFDARFATLMPLLTSSGHTRDEVVTMASIIEREANTDADRKLIAGILWKRLALGMPLQVDAVFAYIKGLNAYAPTLDDLKLESPYNTYLHKGLPPTPIGNPGLAVLEATLTPTKSSYLYYLTGTDGKMHYATTFAGHQANRVKYLK